jgi:hypothetical protein
MINKILTQENIEYVISIYPYKTNREIAELIGCSKSTIEKLGQKI